MKGLGFQLVLICECGKKYIDSCKCVEKGYEVNNKIIFVLRLLGVGIFGFKLFGSLMDLTTNFSNYFYYKAIDQIKSLTKCVKNLVIEKADKEEKMLNVQKSFKEDELTVWKEEHADECSANYDGS